MTSMSSTEEQSHFISLALAEAAKCPVVSGAFSVGCVLVHNHSVISTGFSRELQGNTHAEANAIDKLEDRSILPHVDLYTTLEPCTVRTSGLHPCTATIIQKGIKRVFIGASEPPDFVVCEGVNQLRQAAIDVIFVDSTSYTKSTGRILGEDCLAAARRGE
ncbi:hypothetical protein E3P98_02074 [Wallemia ichthyophaga]|nr:hypothetical protein E3P98_02074 [Wallemia ichthyophaga]